MMVISKVIITKDLQDKAAAVRPPDLRNTGQIKKDLLAIGGGMLDDVAALQRLADWSFSGYDSLEKAVAVVSGAVDHADDLKGKNAQTIRLIKVAVLKGKRKRFIQVGALVQRIRRAKADNNPKKMGVRGGPTAESLVKRINNAAQAAMDIGSPDEVIGALANAIKQLRKAKLSKSTHGLPRAHKPTEQDKVEVDTETADLVANG